MPPHNRIAEFFETYTRDLKAEDLQRLFTRDTRDAYRFFARHVDLTTLEALPWHRTRYILDVGTGTGAPADGLLPPGAEASGQGHGTIIECWTLKSSSLI